MIESRHPSVMHIKHDTAVHHIHIIQPSPIHRTSNTHHLAGFPLQLYHEEALAEEERRGNGQVKHERVEHDALDLQHFVACEGIVGHLHQLLHVRRVDLLVLGRNQQSACSEKGTTRRRGK